MSRFSLVSFGTFDLALQDFKGSRHLTWELSCFLVLERVVHLLVLSQSSGGPSFETALSYMPGSSV